MEIIVNQNNTNINTNIKNTINNGFCNTSLCKLVSFSKAIKATDIKSILFYRSISDISNTTSNNLISCDRDLNGKIDNYKIIEFPSNKLLISYSADYVTYSNPIVYGSSDFTNIFQNIENDVYLRIYITDSSLAGSVEYSFSTIMIGGILYHIGLDFTISITSDASKNIQWSPNCIDPYANLDCALILQQQLSDQVICMLGIPIYYFRVDPIEKSRDIVFKEYTLHQVVQVKQLKLMLQDGQLPSSNHRLTEFGFDWETDWEVELSKTQFATAFGDKVFPKTRDFIYVPLMRRMWTVNAAYDERADMLMWRSTTWKLSLLKYSEADNINISEGSLPDSIDFDSIIDSLNLYDPYEEDFDLDRANKESTYNQINSPSNKPDNNSLWPSNNKIIDLKKFDNLRESIEYIGNLLKTPNLSDLNIGSDILCHKNNIIARNFYSILPNSYHKFLKTSDNGIRPYFKINYSKKISYKNSNKLSLSLLLYIKITDTKSLVYDNNKKEDLILFGFNNSKDSEDLVKHISILFDQKTNNLVFGNSYIQTEIHYLTNNEVYLLEYSLDNINSNKISLNVYKQLYPTDRPLYTIKPEQRYFEFYKGTEKDFIDDDFYSNDFDKLYLNIRPGYQIHKFSVYNLKDQITKNNNSLVSTEISKYQSNSPHIIINDLCRPFTTNEVGFSVK